MIIDKVESGRSSGEISAASDTVLVSFLNPYSYLKLRKVSDVYHEVDFFIVMECCSLR